jgi:phosphatidylserine decarboxylase
MSKSSTFHVPFHHEGYPFIAGAVVVTMLLIVTKFFCIAAIITAWVFYFFRDPERVTPTRPGLVISPADGRVVKIEEVVPDAELGLDNLLRTRISVFLNVFDVHVNRVPADGKIVAANYRKGKFINAARDKASVDNERMALAIELTGDHPYKGKKLGVVQIAGLIARRIVCDAKKDMDVKAGDRYGIIRFGSRADIYLPQGVQPLVCVGQYMIGGETVLADCAVTEPARVGEVRP